ncbi:MAG: nuclear transport factor 2 family protein [Thermosynechococcaceae cyanobacterium]
MQTPRNVIEDLYAAIAARDMQRAAGHLDPDADFYITPGLPHQDPFYKGRDAFVNGVWKQLKMTYVPNIQAQISEYLSGTDVVTVIGRYIGTAMTGRAIDIGFVHAWTVRSGHVIALQVHTDAPSWNRALATP